MEITLNKNSIELINRIGSISEIVLRKHIDLIDFEYDKIEYDSTYYDEERKETLENIKLAEEVEFNLYKEFSQNNSDELIEYLISDLPNVDFTDDLKAIIEDQNLLLCLRRMCNRIAVNQLARDAFNQNVQNNPYFQNMSLYQGYYSKYKFVIIQEQDTINRFIHYLDEEIANNPLYRKKLIESKYFTLFVTERYFQGIDRFTCDRFVTSTSSQGKILGMKPQNIKKLDDEYNIMRYIEISRSLLELNDEEVYDPDIEVKIILRKCLFKAILTGFSFAKLDEIRDIKKALYPKYYNSLGSHQIGKEIIDQCIVDSIKDKQKIIVRDITYGNTF